MVNNIDIAFLKSKSFERRSGWNGSSIDTVCSSSGNIQLLTDDIYHFTEYNFLPVDGSSLDGHYEFYVNIRTFDYLVYQNGYYGSLTYITEPKVKGIIELNELDIKIVEAKIAHKLLGAYFYNTKYSNSQGSNLFGDGTPEKVWEWGSRSLMNGFKLCLICDWRKYPEDLGKLSEQDEIAINLLKT